MSSKQTHRYFLFQVFGNFGKAFGRNLEGNQRIGSSLEINIGIGTKAHIESIKGKPIEQYFIEQLIEQYFIEQVSE